MTASRGNTPPLARVQADFIAYIRGDDAAMAGKTRATRKADAETLLGVYRNAFPLRLIEALGANFPRLKSVLGDADFDRMGRAYIAKTPPRHFSIRWFGDRLPEFLAREKPWREAPAAAELAGFEWALAAAFDAADAPALDIPAIAAIPPQDWAGLTFAFHPALSIFVSRWTVPEQWNALGDAGDNEVPRPQRRESPVTFALWREAEGRTMFRSLAEDEARMLAAARDGQSFSLLCEGLCAHVSEDRAGPRAAELLRHWVEQGWVTEARAA